MYSYTETNSAKLNENVGYDHGSRTGEGCGHKTNSIGVCYSACWTKFGFTLSHNMSDYIEEVGNIAIDQLEYHGFPCKIFSCIIFYLGIRKR